MAEDAESPISRPYLLWHVQGQNEFVAVVGEAETFDKIRKIRRREDWRYQITRNGALIDEATGFPAMTLPGQNLTKLD